MVDGLRATWGRQQRGPPFGGAGACERGAGGAGVHQGGQRGPGLAPAGSRGVCALCWPPGGGLDHPNSCQPSWGPAGISRGMVSGVRGWGPCCGVFAGSVAGRRGGGPGASRGGKKEEK